MSDHRPTDDEIKAQLLVWLIQWNPRKWYHKILKMWLIKELTD